MTMQEALLKMTSKGFGYAVVVKENKVKGVISDGDLRRNINQLFDKKAGQIATKNPITVKEDIFVAEAIKIMNDNKIGVLVITNNKNRTNRDNAYTRLTKSWSSINFIIKLKSQPNTIALLAQKGE